MPADALPPPSPVAMIELSAAFLPEAAEGDTGFALRRLYLGARWRPAPWATAVATINANGAERPLTVMDAYVRLTPPGPVEASVGFAKTPLLSSARDLSVETLPIPELSLCAGAFWPGRDAGAEAHLASPTLPVEAWLRVGNGSRSPAGNDGPGLAAQARVDLVLGRARVESARELPFGLRLGLGAHVEDAAARSGISGQTPTGFVFWTPPEVEGPVRFAEGHAVAFTGPGMWTVEAAAATEARASGDPTHAWGGVVEGAWMLTGQHRQFNSWPVPADGGLGLELAARGETLALGRGASDLAPGGGTGAELALRLWHARGLGGALHGGLLAYEAPPDAEPEVSRSWFVAARFTARLL